MTLTEQVEILRVARAGLHMWNMDTSGVDKMLAQHGVDIDKLPKPAPVGRWTSAIGTQAGLEVQIQSDVQHG